MGYSTAMLFYCLQYHIQSCPASDPALAKNLERQQLQPKFLGPIQMEFQALGADSDNREGY